MSKKKRNILIIAVLLCVCAAVYLNWSYNNQTTLEDVLANANLAGEKSSEEEVVSKTDDYTSEYFATARLTRQQSRDEAMDLLEQAASSENASQETIDSAMNSIAAMATYSMQETQVENLILAKDFKDCVAFMSADGITLAVPSSADGLTADEVAIITDTILSETDYTAGELKIIEVKAAKIDASAAPNSNESESINAQPEVNNEIADEDTVEMNESDIVDEVIE